MSYQLKTIKGYDLFEVVSAFQKSIRRGKEHDAMFWGVELYESGYIPLAWKRMIVICTEDIGLAYPSAPVIINALKQQYDELSKADDKKQQCRLPYVQAVLFLTHAPKSRITDWALNYWFDSHLFDTHNREIPEYALDIHTRRGKSKGKTITHFFTEGSIVENHKVFTNEKEYADECRKRWENPEWCKQADQEKERRKNMRTQKKGSKNEPQANLFSPE